jgi:hypothetical protein
MADALELAIRLARARLHSGRGITHALAERVPIIDLCDPDWPIDMHAVAQFQKLPSAQHLRHLFLPPVPIVRDAAVGQEKPRVEWEVDQLPHVLDLSEKGDCQSRSYRLHSVHMHGNFHYDSLIAFEGATAAESTTFVNVDCIKKPTTRVAETRNNGYPKMRKGRVCVNVWYRRVDQVDQ